MSEGTNSATETVADKPVEIDYEAFAEEYKKRSKVLAEERDEANRAAMSEYSKVQSAADEERRKARQEADRVYNAAVNGEAEKLKAAEEAIDAAHKEKHKALLAELLGGAASPASMVMAWTVSKGHYRNYRYDYIEPIVEYLRATPEATLADLVKFGRVTRRWCTDYTNYIEKALRDGVNITGASEQEIAAFRAIRAAELSESYGTRRSNIVKGLKNLLEVTGVGTAMLDAFPKDLIES
jgi:hypothetical protein